MLTGLKTGELLTVHLARLQSLQLIHLKLGKLRGGVHLRLLLLDNDLARRKLDYLRLSRVLESTNGADRLPHGSPRTMSRLKCGSIGVVILAGLSHLWFLILGLGLVVALLPPVALKVPRQGPGVAPVTVTPSTVEVILAFGVGYGGIGR